MADATNFSSLLSADRPIEGLEDDRLNRGEFATNIARIFHEWKGRDSLVIALYGPWGMGKTSLKNLILKALPKTTAGGSKSSEVLQFTPWQWVGHSNMTTAFFNEVSKTIGHSVGDEKAKRAAKSIRAYAAFLSAGRTVLEGLPKLLVNVCLLVGAMGFGASVSQGLSAIGPVISAVIFGALTVAAILGLSETILEKISTWASARIESDTKTLSERKKDLADALRKLDRNILVIVDDIDRLTPMEIRTVFQLVKANADFPNFIYFLPFQRDLVAKALDPDTTSSGDQFLEKIVQIGFDIPLISQSDIDRIIEEKLNVLFSTEMSAKSFSKDRWISTYHGGLRHYFPDLRRVNRFASSLAFHVELLKKQGVLEVDPIDLIAIETLRLFEPATYHRLRAAKDLMVGYASAAREEKDALKKKIQSIYADSKSPGNVAGVLSSLFPNRGSAFGAMNYESGRHPEWTANLQICTPEFYDRYFQLTIPESDITQVEAMDLIRISGTSGLLDRLRAYNKEQRLPAALDRFEGSLDQVQSESIGVLITTLLNIGEELPEAEPGFFSIGAEWNIQRMIKKLLEREPEKKNRAETMCNALSGADGLSVAVSMIGRELRARNENKLNETIFDEPEISNLRDLCVSQIRKFADNGKLAQQDQLAHILFRWAEWTNEAEVQLWVSQLIDTQDGALLLLKRFTQRSVASTGGPLVRVTWFIRLSQLERFANLTTLQARAKTVRVAKDDVEGQRALAAFDEAIARRAKGEKEDDIWRD